MFEFEFVCVRVCAETCGSRRSCGGVSRCVLLVKRAPVRFLPSWMDGEDVVSHSSNQIIIVNERPWGWFGVLTLVVSPLRHHDDVSSLGDACLSTSLLPSSSWPVLTGQATGAMA